MPPFPSALAGKNQPVSSIVGSMLTTKRKSLKQHCLVMNQIGELRQLANLHN